jgi:diguanylate cyclase (GGDEF)-like protein/PAS domain S-box-containing protein
MSLPDPAPRPAPGTSGRPFGCPAPEALLALARLSDDAILIVREDIEDGTREIAWSNPAFDRLLGHASGHLIGHPVRSLWSRHLGGGLDGSPVVAAAPSGATTDPTARQDLLDAECGQADVHLRRGDGSAALVRASVAPVDAPDARHWAVILREIGAEVRADEHLRASEERFRALAVNAPIGIFFSEVGLRFGYVNARLADLWGRPEQDLLGMGWLDAVHPDDVERVVGALSQVLSGEEIDQPLRIHRPDGALRWVRARATPMVLPGKGAGFIGSLEDVTEGRRHEEALAHQANHDPLTGLPNRTLLWSTLQSILEGRRASDPAVALLFFDLDNFKLVNDSLGHLVGDQLLIQVATRLREKVRPGDVVARFGGDEFVVLCPSVGSEPEAVAVAERLRSVLEETIVVPPYDIRVTASVGVAVTSDGSTDVETLVRNADVAMYQAKGGGKARSALFDEEVRSGIEERLALTMDLRRAVDDGEISVAYQPVVEVSTGRITSIEALARWDHPTRGTVPPSEFVPLAEETGVIASLGTWVLREACSQLARWRHQLGSAAPAYVAVNVSAHQLLQADLPEIVMAALAESGLDGRSLCLELTESVLMADAEASMAALSTLQGVGVRFAIDDFGTGYSSLAYLRRFSVEVLKVDQSFVAGLDHDGEDAAIVNAVISLARSLGLAVVAEGVETPAQLDRLIELGCGYAQGYLLGGPVRADVLAAVLRATRLQRAGAGRR